MEAFLDFYLVQMVHKNDSIFCIADYAFVTLTTYAAQQNNINCLQKLYQLEIWVFWDVSLCWGVCSFQCNKGLYCLHLQSQAFQ